MSYKSFAGFYDSFTTDVGYKERAEYMLALFARFDKTPELLLDVGCGTGAFSYEFAEKGIEVIGVDPSAEMLSIASSRTTDAEKPPIFLCQSAQNLDLYGTVDGAVACLDTVNHITDLEELSQAFGKISLFLEPDRLFVFDANTLYKHKNVLSGKKFIYDNGKKLCIWKNSRCSRNGTVKMKLKLYENTQNGYIKYTDSHSERAYSREELENALKNCGFEVLGVYGDLSFDSPKENEERIYIVAKKVK